MIIIYNSNKKNKNINNKKHVLVSKEAGASFKQLISTKLILHTRI